MKNSLFLALSLTILLSITLGIVACGKSDVSQNDGFTVVSQDESQEIAEDYLRNTSTFKYDGIEDSVKLIAIHTMRCPYCWEFTFEFQTRHAGHGDRTGEILAQVITTHTARIVVQEGKVVSAVCCDNWDMLRREIIDEQGEPVANLTVAELLENPVYDTTVKIHGEVSGLGEFFCPCFELASGGQKVQVWYGLMVDNDGTERSAVSVEGINNGDKVIVTGELKGEGGTHYSKGDFWATDIGIVE